MRSKRTLTLITSLLILIGLLAAPVYAYEEPLYWIFCFSDLPEGTAYVDLLIPLDTSAPVYTDMVSENIPQGFSPDAQIYSYCEDGFRSYSFHYHDARSDIQLQSDRETGSSRVYYFTDGDDNEENYRPKHLYAIREASYIRLAMLDAQGNILQVSPTLNTKSTRLFGYTGAHYFYNSATQKLSTEQFVDSVSLLVYIFLFVITLLFSSFLKWLGTAWFKPGKRYIGLILLTNLFIQVGKWGGYVLLYSPLFFYAPWAVILLELLAWIVEWLWLRKRLSSVSYRKSLAFTIASNLVSLAPALYIYLRMIF